MKKTKLTRSLLAACSIVALTAVMYGCVHNGGDDEPELPVVTPDPPPDPVPTDLDDTQAAAAAAATAALTASTNAAASAKSAMDDTMYLATLQSGDDLNSKAMGGNEHADAASDAAVEAAANYAAAKAASEEAAAATTGAEGEAAWRKAVDAQADAEAAATKASEYAAAAAEAAKSELHIKGTVKSVGESSIDADADKSSSPPVPATAGVLTGFQDYVTSATADVPGKAFVHMTDRSKDQAYVQAVEGRPVHIGKTLDTTDDAARLTVIHSRVGSKKVSVYAVDDSGKVRDFVIRTDAAGVKTEGANAAEINDAEEDGETNPGRTLKSLGTYYEAAAAAEAVPSAPDAKDDIRAKDMLDHTDTVGAETKGKAVFSYVQSAKDPARYVVEKLKTVNSVTGDTDVTYQHVDVTVIAAPDISRDPGTGPDAHEQVQVKASIPMAIEYDHIHFGVWAALDEATLAGQKVAGLGIGFVQNFSGSGVTDRLGIGTVSYNGDWVAVIQRQNSAAKGAYSMGDGAAKLTADFDKGKFTGALTGLATLSGTLDGNGFSGVKAAAIKHPDLDPLGTFAGEFSGGIYGPTGSEAAGVFDFAGGEAGSFRGAFGGTNQE